MDKNKKSKVLPVIGLIIIILLVALIMVPLLLKNQIKAKALATANENINAEISIDKVSLSLFKSFPDLQFGIKGLEITGKGKNAGISLAKIGSLSLDINLKSALKKEIRINSIIIESPEIIAILAADGTANWDIAKEQAAAETKEAGSPAAFNLIMQDLQIRNAVISFRDEKQGTSTLISNLDLNLKGDFTEKDARLQLATEIKKINFEQSGVKLVKDLHLNFTAGIGIDLEKRKFTFAENRLQLNELELGFNGSVELPADGSMLTDITFNAGKTDFKDLLSFVPAAYMKDFADIRTEGKLQFNGFAKGLLEDDILPAFGLELEVEDALVQYPELPAAIHDINIDVKIANPGGTADLTTINVNRFELMMQDNPLQASLLISTLVSNPDILANMNIDLDLNTLKNVLPLEQLKIAGVLKGRISLNTKLSTIEKEQYEKVGLQGGVTLTDFVYKSPDITQEIKIKNADLKFTPWFVELKQFTLNIAATDLNLQGKVENFLPFVLEGKELQGNLEVNSNLIDANQLMTLSTVTQHSESASPKEVKAIVIPENLNLILKCSLKKILFDQMEITALTGDFELKEAVAALNNLRFDTLKGGVRITGTYHGQSAANAGINGSLNLWKLDVREAFKSLSVLQKTLPILDYSSGNISGKMSLDAQLDDQMQPVLETVNSNGNLNTSEIIIENSPVLNDIAENLKNPKLKKVILSATDISYTMTDGNLKISPFTTNFSSSSAIISGTVSAQQELNIKLQTRLAISDLGDEARKQITDLVSQINKTGMKVTAPEFLNVPVMLTGSVTQPKVGMDWQSGFENVIKSLQEQLMSAGKDKLKDEATDLLKGLFKK
ncbi:MAG: AsmA family protein [Candidatus Cloacimonetes bacterium]|nr:AsmA family protein [Candidatus Cloacimonadota bacterium]